MNKIDPEDIKARLGPLPAGRTSFGVTPGGGPDTAAIEADPVVKALRGLGRIVSDDMVTWSTGEQSLQILCPWSDEHTGAAGGTFYVPVAGKFKCHHGHCDGRGRAEFLERLGELLTEDSGGLIEGVAALDFDTIDPESVSKPPYALPKTDEAIDLWDDKASPRWPGGVLPAVLEDTIAELAERDGLDIGALGAVFLTVASGAADKRALLRPYAGSHWQVRPVLWLMLIAESGQRKTATLDHLLNLLRRRNAERMRQYRHDMALWRRLPALQRNQQPAPIVRALLAEDTTLERLQEWMSENSRGLLCQKDELAALFEFGRYSSGNGAAERANLLQFYEGGPYTVGRMTRTTVIDNCALSLIGGIQPQRLAKFKDLSDDGLISRFGTLIMQPGREPFANQNAQTDITAINATIERLLALGPEYYHTDRVGEEIIRDLEKIGYSLARRPDIGNGYRGFLSKLHGTHARTALVLHLIDGGQDQLVPEDTVMRAARYAIFLADQAALFYAGLTGSAEHTAQAIGSYLLRHPTKRITAGTLRSQVAACRSLQSLKEIQDALFLLVIGGWLQPENVYPANNSWLVRPGLEDQFAARLQLEIDRVEKIKGDMNHQGKYR